MGIELFYQYDCRNGFVIIDENYQPDLVIFLDYKGGGSEVIAKYASVTAMMLTIADCYKQAFYRDANGYLKCNEKIAREIWRKHNSQKIVEKTLNRIKKVEDELFKINLNIVEKFLHEIEDTLKFSQDIRLVAPLLRINAKTMLSLNSSCGWNLSELHGLVSRLITLDNANTIDSFILALKNEYWQTRYWAAYTLGYFKDKRAIESLIEILDDHNKDVRKMARESLNRLVSEIPGLEDKIPF